MPDHVTREEFQTFAKGLDHRLDAFGERLEDALAVRDEVNSHGRELAVLADRSNRAERRTAGISAIVSGAVAGILIALRQWWSHA